MKKVFTRLALLLMLCTPVLSHATHLMGGSLTYSFVSFNSGNNTYTYSVELRIYRYCTGMTSALDNSLQMGAYIQNPALPLANKTLAGSFTLPLVSQQFITPPNPNPNCSFSSNVCVEEGIYRTSIILPASTGGYHLIVERCCRNNNISNLINPGGAGQVYYAFIPPSSTRNSSPTFASIPVPFICAGDTTSILNAAFDSDGDSLAYSFVTPYNGTANSGNPNPGTQNPYPWPITTVFYDSLAGYSLAHPFGSGGYASIDATTGLASYMSPNQGFYVIAVEIREYRNGLLIGVTRRDLQIIVIPCPVNNAPTFNTGGQTSYTVAEGTNLCFSVSSNDVNNDSIFLSATGPIFNSGQTNPPANITINNGAGSSTAQFCWPTSCDQGRPSSYQFTLSALDNGCPAKTSNVVYTINVLPTTISVITGPDTVCSSSASTNLYSVVPETGFTYNWLVSGGTQVSGGSTSTAGIQWTANNGTVSAYAVNSQGCHSDTSSKSVVASNPIAQAGPDVAYCSGDAVMLNGATGPQQTYQWSPSTGLSNSTIPNPTVSLTNTGSTPLHQQYILTVTQLACSASDTVVVTVNPLPVVTANPVSALCINAAPVTLTGTPAGGTFTGTGVTANSFNPATAGAGSHTVVYHYTDLKSCSSADTISIAVNALPSVDAGTYASLCISAQPVTLSGTPAGGTFTGAGVSGSSFNPAAAGIGNHTVIYSYTDGNGCTNTDSATLAVTTLPTVNAGLDFSLCINGNPASLSGTPAGGSFSGTGVSGGIFNPSVAGVGAHTVVYSYSDSSGCANTDTLTATVNALPSVQAGTYAPVCVNGASVSLAGTPAGGSFSGTGVTGTSFDPSAAGAGSHTITYAYTDGNGCSASNTATIVVNALPVVNAGIDFSVCVDASPIILAGTPLGGTYTGAGIAGNTFDPSVAGAGSHGVSYSYTDGNGCAATDNLTITVNSLPSVSMSALNSLCTTSAPVTLTGGTPSGGTYSGTGVSNGVFDPAVSGAGTFSIVYSFTDPNGCSNNDSASVTVYTQPIVTFAAMASTCVNSAPFALTGGSPAGGTYSGPGVSNGMFDPAVAGLGTHTITYTLAGQGGCTGTATSSISVGTEPQVSLTVSQGVGCQSNTIFTGYGPQYLIVTASTSSTGVTYAWYKDGTLLPGRTSDTLQVTLAGVYNVVVTDPSGCSSSPASPASISTIYVVDVRCGNGLKKVVLCHVPPGNPGNPQTLCIAPSAVPAHLSNHPGDCLGPCPNQRLGTEAVEGNLQLLSQPNPFSTHTILEFTVFESSRVTIELFDMEGKLLSVPYSADAEHDVLYTTDIDGTHLSDGVYFIRATAGDTVTYHKLIKTH